MKKIGIVFFVFAFVNAALADGDTLFVKKNVDMVLRNPMLPGNFYVRGTLSLLEDRLSFKVNTDVEFIRSSRIYRYNNLVKDIDIPYYMIKKIRRGCFKLVLASKLLIVLESGKKYRFDTISEKKKIITIVRGKLICG